MKRLSPAANRTPVDRRNCYRPRLEQLENRLPTGVMLGLLVSPWAAVGSFSWEQSSPASEIASADPIPDIGRSEQVQNYASLRSPDLLFAGIDISLRTIQHDFRVEDSLPLSSSPLAEQQNDNFALASLSTSISPLPNNRPGRQAPVSPGPVSAVTAASPAAQLPTGASAAGNATAAPRPTDVASNPSGPSRAMATPRTTPPANKSPIAQDYGQLPLRFEANQGQTDRQVQFLSSAGAYTLFLTGSEAVLSLREPAIADGDTASPADGTLHMQVVGANASSRPVGVEELTGKVNYLLGRDPAQWHTDIPTYARVEYPDIYDGINLVYYGNQQQLEYDFVVAPGADPATITLGFGGAEQVGIDGQGDLVLETAGGTVRQPKPTIYQDVNGVHQEIGGSYVLKGREQIGFQIGAYDPAQTLVIDPVLAYSTYLGGSRADLGNAIAVDSAGNIYVTGDTTSSDFPTANPMQPSYGGGTSNAFVAKLDPTGSTLLYSTYLGGEGFDRGNGIAVDASGSVYVVGKTNSLMFPITPGAFEDTFRGPEFDAFVTKISPAGDQLEYSTYLGGDNNDAGTAIAVDPSGDAYVTGGTKSNDFPATQSAYQGANNGGTNAFVTEINPTGTDVLYSTFLGGSFTDRGNAIAVDANGFVYVTGHTNSDDFPIKNALQSNYGGGLDNAFVAKLNPQAAGDDSLIYSTFLGGSGSDKGLGIAVDGAGNVYVAGETSSADFPIVNALQPTYGGGTANAFVAEIDSTGTTLLFATYLGGSGDDRASALAMDANGNLYVTGSTSSTDFPMVNAIQPNPGGGSDAFVAKLTSDGNTLIYSTYLGGSGDEDLYQNGVNIGAIAVDAAGDAFVTGQTTSADFPTVNPLQPALLGSSNAFIAEISG